jgi:hypothetical protein
MGRIEIIWDLTVEQEPLVDACELRAPAILAALEEQLAILDIIGAHLAAAHLDAAIQRFRLDQKRPPKQPFPA